LKSLTEYAEPTFDQMGRIESCPDLTALEGIASYMQDILWISWFVHVGTMFSDWFWLVYCVIPCYAFYIAYDNMLKPLLAMRAGMKGGGGGGGSPQRAGSRSERRKQEQMSKKPKPKAEKAKPRARS